MEKVICIQITYSLALDKVWAALMLCFYVVLPLNHFTYHGSNVYAATLDIKKAFDMVN